MALGFSYTLTGTHAEEKPAMTGHAAGLEDACRTVEQLLTRDNSMFCGFVRNLDAPERAAAWCMKARSGRFVWMVW